MSAPRRNTRGWSVVELMVGIAVSMVGIALMLDSLVRFEPQKRATASGATAVNDGAYGMYWLTREIQTAGYGLVTTPVTAAPATLGTPGVPTLLGCTARFLYTDGSRLARGSVQLSPVIIGDRFGDSAPDSITVAYANTDVLATPVQVVAPITSASQPLPTASNVGFHLGDVVALVDMDAAKHAASPNRNCFFAQITGPSTSARNGDPVSPTGALERAISPAFPFNAAGGVSSLSGQTRIVNLGQAPSVVRYSIQRSGDQSRLIATDLLRSPGRASVVADGVIDMQAQYGIDTDNDDRVDQWVEPVGTWSDASLTPLQIASIKAIRLALLVRAGQDESRPGETECSATSDRAAREPLLPASASPAMPSSGPPLNADTDARYRCYRYKVFRATVSVRNMVWSNL